MKLDIIIPHYREPWSTCKYLFDSIALQRGIHFDDIRVIVVNDGDNILFGSMENAMLKLSTYPFTVDYIVKEHGGVSAARNCGLDGSNADYVMFCDIDDGFLSNCGLHLVFNAMKERGGADAMKHVAKSIIKTLDKAIEEKSAKKSLRKKVEDIKKTYPDSFN